VLNKKVTFVLNARNQPTGRAGIGSFAQSVIRIVKFVMKIPLIATLVEKVIGLTISLNDVLTSGQATWSAIQLKTALKCPKNVLPCKENVKV